jgi:hypothetical protein
LQLNEAFTLGEYGIKDGTTLCAFFRTPPPLPLTRTPIAAARRAA